MMRKSVNAGTLSVTEAVVRTHDYEKAWKITLDEHAAYITEINTLAGEEPSEEPQA